MARFRRRGEPPNPPNCTTHHVPDTTPHHTTPHHTNRRDQAVGALPHTLPQFFCLSDSRFGTRLNSDSSSQTLRTNEQLNLPKNPPCCGLV
ncbi:hypothetical protein Cob_v007004 [Colletotrichum orbiculare MAFF 240422]|uniref:Uncharacterized protein n=1 Tax=Colletotrichum orbiculare (strain 104-T / ATCC 96160 / CBS 514.97 / LARS 414 / MAFF 240422) TaxID=1213857 RepID=N4UXV5_COLOR|nr:hypothetical protein Cob_v007004 [Colletotrichum orbiculare MAFF 240422]